MTATAFTAENAENAKDSPRAVRNAKCEMRNQGERSRRPRSATHVGRGAPRLLRPISWAFAPRKRGVASAFQAEVAAPPALLPPFPPGRHGDRLTLDGAEPPLNLRRPPRRTEEEDGGMPPRHPGPKGRGYRQPRPMNRPDPPVRVPTACAVGYRLSPRPGLTSTGRACPSAPLGAAVL